MDVACGVIFGMEIFGSRNWVLELFFWVDFEKDFGNFGNFEGCFGQKVSWPLVVL